jgi:hypothetical protein
MADEEVPVETPAETGSEGKQLDAAMARFEGHFVESADLMSKQVTLTIAGVVPPNTEADAKKKLINRPILSFNKTSKRLILGKTNERIIRAIHGPKASGWLGKAITLSVRYLPEAFGEKNVPTVRVVPPVGIPLPMNCRKHYGMETPPGR